MGASQAINICKTKLRHRDSTTPVEIVVSDGVKWYRGNNSWLITQKGDGHGEELAVVGGLRPEMPLLGVGVWISLAL